MTIGNKGSLITEKQNTQKTSSSSSAPTPTSTSSNTSTDISVSNTRTESSQKEDRSESQNLLLDSKDALNEASEGLMKALDQTTLEDGHNVLSYDTFESMELKQTLLRGIYSMGFEKPSPIQQRGIMPIAQGKDVIAQSQSGTGKTATFTIGMLSVINEELRETQALVLSPTRELASQSYETCLTLGDFMNLSMHNCIGGTNMRQEIYTLNQRPQIVIGTPGRILHMAQEGHLNLRYTKILILDEMDVLLDSGFKDSIYDIFFLLPQSVQVVLISATMPNEALEVSKKFMRDPIRILLKRDVVSLVGIKQFYIELEEGYKLDTLLDLYASLSVSQSVVFCNTIRKAEYLESKLREQKFSVSVVHSNMTTEERAKELARFKTVQSRVLISTDVLARGIDVQGVSVVINYDLPKSKENYIHRIGRCGRYGRKGIAINFMTSQEVDTVRAIEKYYNTQVLELPSDFKKYL